MFYVECSVYGGLFSLQLVGTWTAMDVVFRPSFLFKYAHNVIHSYMDTNTNTGCVIPTMMLLWLASGPGTPQQITMVQHLAKEGKPMTCTVQIWWNMRHTPLALAGIEAHFHFCMDCSS